LDGESANFPTGYGSFGGFPNGVPPTNLRQVQRSQEILKEMLDGSFSASSLLQVINRLQFMLMDVLAADAYQTSQDPKAHFDFLRNWALNRMPAVQAYVSGWLGFF